MAEFGFRVCTVITGDKFSFVCYAFVNDSDVVHSHNVTKRKDDMAAETETLVQEMQQAIDTWEGGLRASGGALVPAKSYWFLIHFIFKNNKWRYARIRETPRNITIRNTQGNGRVELKRLKVEEACETLGVFIAMDRNQKAQTMALWEKSNPVGRQNLSRTFHTRQSKVLLAILRYENIRISTHGNEPFQRTMRDHHETDTGSSTTGIWDQLTFITHRCTRPHTVSRSRNTGPMDGARYCKTVVSTPTRRCTDDNGQSVEGIHGTSYTRDWLTRTTVTTGFSNLRTLGNHKLAETLVGVLYG
jgi:hypothetical protein